jgi:hypothetical protein
LTDTNNVDISPVHHGTTYTTTSGTINPGVRFTQNTSIGSLYAQFRAPYDYLRPGRDDTRLRLQSRLGWSSTFGLSLYAQVVSRFVPDVDLYTGSTLYAAYPTDSLGNFDVTFTLPKEVSSGITINPTWGYDFENSSLSLDFSFDGVAASEGDIEVTFTPYVEYYAGAFTFYASFEFYNVTKANGSGMSFSPTLGVKFEF